MLGRRPHYEMAHRHLPVDGLAALPQHQALAFAASGRDLAIPALAAMDTKFQSNTAAREQRRRCSIEAVM